MPRGGNAAASSSSPAPAPAEPGAAPASISRGVKLSRKKHLVATEVGECAWIVRGVLSPKEASRLVSSADARGYARATSRGPKHGEARRDHGRAGYDDDAFAVALWRDTGLAEAVDASPIADLVAARGGGGGGRRPAGLNPSLRVYKYAPGEVFGAHFDDSADTALGRTELTFLLYLTGGGGGGGGGVIPGINDGTLHGGDTVFYRGAHDDAKETHRVKPVCGTSLMFRHGAACAPHASEAVQRGIKIVLRSDVVFN